MFHGVDSPRLSVLRHAFREVRRRQRRVSVAHGADQSVQHVSGHALGPRRQQHNVHQCSGLDQLPGLLGTVDVSILLFIVVATCGKCVKKTLKKNKRYHLGHKLKCSDCGRYVDVFTFRLSTYLDVQRVLEYLAYLGYMYEHDTQLSAIHGMDFV